MILVISFEQYAYLYDAADGHFLNYAGPDNARTVSVAFSADGSFFVSGSDDGDLQVWNVAEHKLLRTLQLPQWSGGNFNFSADGKKIVLTSFDNVVRIWDWQTGDLVKELKGHTRDILSVVCDVVANNFITVFSPGTIKRWDLFIGKLLSAIELDSLTGLRSPDSVTRLYVEWKLFKKQ
jgi:WD40 repeat protein